MPFSGASSIPLCYIPFPSTLFHQLVFHPPSLHLATYFLVYLFTSLFPNSYIIWLWEFYFHPNQRNLQGQSKKKPNLFNLNLLLYLQLNQTCLLQSTPLYCWYTTSNVFSSSGTRPGMCFAGWCEGPVANFLLSPLLSEIGDLLGWTSTLGTGKSPQGPNLESRGDGARQSSLASPKIHG